MYRAMLIDDEKSIRDYLPRVFPFGEHGFEIVATAASGEEALEKLPLVRPEMILLDVRMPGMGGLEFFRRLREFGNADIQVIMLSGYSDFQYAKEAMRYGAAAYLLKPIDEDEAYPVLDDVRVTLDRIHSEAMKRDMIKRADAVNRLLDGKHENVAHDFSLLLVVRTSKVPFDNTSAAIADVLDDSNESPVICVRERGPIHVYLLKKSPCDDTAKHIRDLLLAAGLDCAVDTLEIRDESIANKQYVAALRKMLRALFYCGTRLCACDVPVAEDADAFDYYKWRIWFSDLIEAGCEGEVRGALNALFEMIESKCPELERIQLESERIWYIMQDLCNSSGAEIMYPKYNWRDSDYFVTLFDFRAMLSDESMRLCRVAAQRRENKRLGVVGDVIEYVDAHYTEQLTLMQVSQIFYMNATYLGRAFQKATGEAFKQYINRRRIEESLRLLNQTELKIYEIAERVGYPESKYFISKFTESQGMSPSEYREGKRK